MLWYGPTPPLQASCTLRQLDGMPLVSHHLAFWAAHEHVNAGLAAMLGFARLMMGSSPARAPRMHG